MQIDGSAAIVVGGASGLGAAAARLLAERGARVLIADLDAERGEALAAEIGGSFAKADITDEASMQAAVKAAAEQSDGGLRIAVNSAGVGWAEKLLGKQGPHDLAAFEKVVRINLIGTFNALRLQAAAMAANEPNDEGERGVVVNTASIAAFDGQIGQVAYSASKGGVVGLTLPAARELASVGVRVVAIAPGLFDTPLLRGLPEPARKALAETIPFPARLGDPLEYGQLVCHIVGNPMLNGETIRLDGALRMAPK